jgi:hypothetical protein
MIFIDANYGRSKYAYLWPVGHLLKIRREIGERLGEAFVSIPHIGSDEH